MKQVLVVGPPLAGVSGVLAALSAALPQHAVVGADHLDRQPAPDAVVAVVSAVAPMAGSDWALIARAAAQTDLVVGVVAKIDAHRTWRGVLAANRTLGAAHGRPMPWVGVAAAPPLGEPNVDDLVAELLDRLADPDLARRNAVLRRSALERRRRPAASRAELQQARLRLLRSVRDGCAALRANLRDAAAEVPAGGAGHFEARVRGEIGEFLADLDEEISRAVAELAGPAAPAPSEPPSVLGAPTSSGRLETRLMAVLGVGFGLGVALTVSRLLAGLAPGLAVAGWVAGGLLGLALLGWVVRTRAVLHDRGLLDRWVTEVTSTLRWHGEAMVSERLLAAEVAGVRRRAAP